MHRFRVSLAAAALAGAGLFGLSAAPAEASTVTVKLGITAGAYAPTGAACTLEVSPGANGMSVLGAAVAKGCIVSYQTTTYAGYGTFVRCVNEVCQVNEATTFWMMSENGVATSYGVDGFSAQDGDELTFTYTSWVAYLLGL